MLKSLISCFSKLFSLILCFSKLFPSKISLIILAGSISRLFISLLIFCSPRIFPSKISLIIQAGSFSGLFMNVLIKSLERESISSSLCPFDFPFSGNPALVRDHFIKVKFQKSCNQPSNRNFVLHTSLVIIPQN